MVELRRTTLTASVALADIPSPCRALTLTLILDADGDEHTPRGGELLN